MKLVASFAAVALALTTFACASPTEDVSGAESAFTAPGPHETACGGFLGTECAADEVCTYTAEEMCGAADHLGTCKKRPEICMELYAPVCGCDGKTYANSCFAGAAGTSVSKQGECESTTTFCPMVFAPVCGADGKTYTNECQAGIAGTSVKHSGECTDKPGTDGPGAGVDPGDPVVCPAVFAPVCGVDGKTYSNSCMAGAANTAIASEGACK